MELPFNITLEDLKTILKTAYRMAKNTPRSSIWSAFIQEAGRQEYHGDELKEPVELDYYEHSEGVEDVMAFCRCKKTGKIYPKSLYDYVAEKLREELGREPEEYEVYESLEGYCEFGECNPPDDFCGEDEYFGDVHTHPHYSITPSCNDADHMAKSRLKVLCIASGEDFACVLADPNSVVVPCRSGDIEHKSCIRVKTHKENFMGNIVEEELNICPEEFIRGYDSAWVQEVRRLVREGHLKGVCHRIKGSSVLGDRVICDFSNLKEIVDFNVEELEEDNE